MTTSASPNESHIPSHGAAGQQGAPDRPDLVAVPVRVFKPGDLFAAVPAMLGFRPEHSVIALSIGGSDQCRIDMVMRHDLLLDDRDRPLMHETLERFADVADREGAQSMILMCIDDRFAEDLRDGTDPTVKASVLELVQLFDEVLARREIYLADVFVAQEIAGGRSWASLAPFGGEGIQSDPRDSAVAAEYVLGGRAIHGCRDELVALLTTTDVAAQLWLGGYLDDLRACREPVDPRDFPGHRPMLEILVETVRGYGSTGVLEADDVAEIAFGLTHPPVRDAALAFVLGELAQPAESLWLHLTRMLPGTERGAPATLLAFSAYLRGDGPLAGVALDVALTADPQHVLARLLDTALRSGMRPERIRELAEVGVECATRIGVELPTITQL